MPADLELDLKLLPPGTRVGAYTVESQIGEGGQGALYRVSRGARVYTLKISTARRAHLSKAERSEIDGRFRREIATLLATDHPNVVKVISWDWWPDAEAGYPYFVMEHVEGDPILRWQEKTLPSLRAICDALRQTAGALRELHEHGTIHRDVKSDNLLVRREGTPVLIDFGIARQQSAHTVTDPADILGTRTHLSPDFCRHIMELRGEAGERYLFQPTDDTHAIGVILYELLVGRAPFESEDGNQWELLRDIANRVPARPRELNPKVPPALDEIAMALLEKRGERRMDATKLVAALENALSEADAGWDVPFEPPFLRAAPHPDARANVDLHAEEKAAGPRRVTRKRPALVAIGVLALVSLAAFSLWSASHRTRTAAVVPPAPTEVPHQPPMSPTAEQGGPTVNDETKRSAPAPVPAVAKAPPSTATRTAGARSCAKILAAAALAAAAACGHVKTGAKAGDCALTPVREIEGQPIPPFFYVRLDPSNAEGECLGGWDLSERQKLEPCPIYEGSIALTLIAATTGPTEEWFGPHGNLQPPQLFGQTSIFYIKGTWPDKNGAKIDRDIIGRMTASITQLRMRDGTMWPVCGVLFGPDEKEGIPILAPEYYGRPVGPRWGLSKVQFYFPGPP